MTTYTLRIMMPDPEQLTPELLSACKSGLVGYVLEVAMTGQAQFVGAANVPTLLDILGANVGGPTAFAFLEDDTQTVPKVTRWFISVMPGVPWGLPSGVRVEARGVSATAGILHGHFELVPMKANMSEYLAKLKELGLIVMPSKDYVPPATIMEALKLAGKHGKG